MSDLRSFLQELEKHDQLIHITDKLSIKHEVAAVLQAFNGKEALFFNCIHDYSTPIVGGICGTRDRIYQAINCRRENFHTVLDNAIKNPTRVSVVSDGPVMEVTEKPRLSNIPILTHYEGDPAPYITSGVVYAQSPKGENRNASIHRLQILDDKHVAIRIVPRQLYRICQLAREEGIKSLDVSIAIGLHPAILLAVAAPVPFGISEYDVANTLLKDNLKLIKCPQVNSYAPVESELVLEGKILLDKSVLEGPFVDLTSTFDVQRDQHPIEIIEVMRRREYFYQALLPAGAEHILLMGMPQEVRILEYARNVNPTIQYVNMTAGGKGWLHCVVSFDKFNDGDGKNVLMAIFSANPSIKHAIVVDSDINVYDMEQVEWALATRFRGDKDLLVIPNARVSSLDPMVDHESGTGCKVGFDATRPFSKPQDKFKQAKIPISDKVNTMLQKYRQRLNWTNKSTLNSLVKD